MLLHHLSLLPFVSCEQIQSPQHYPVTVILMYTTHSTPPPHTHTCSPPFFAAAMTGSPQHYHVILMMYKYMHGRYSHYTYMHKNSTHRQSLLCYLSL